MLQQVDSALLRKDELSKHLQWRLCGRAVTDLSKTSGMHIKSLIDIYKKGKGKAVPLHAMEALGGRGGIAPTHSQPRH
jgi:hypothetical protein